MSLLLELEIPDLDWDLAEQLMEGTNRAGVLRVVGPRRRRWFPGRPHLLVEDDLSDGTSVFDDAAVDAGHYAAITPACREMLARTLLMLAESLEPGWSFHAGWVGDWERELDVEAGELAEMARRSQLDATVKYRVC